MSRKACSGLQEAAFQLPPELTRGCCSIRRVLNLPLKGREGFCRQVGFGRTRKTRGMKNILNQEGLKEMEAEIEQTTQGRQRERARAKARAHIVPFGRRQPRSPKRKTIRGI